MILLRKINSIYELFSLHKYVTDKVNVHAGYTVLLDTLVEFTMNSVIKIIRDVLKTSINENKNIDYESQLLAINIINDSKKFTKTKEAFYSLCTLLEELNAIPNVIPANKAAEVFTTDIFLTLKSLIFLMF